MPENSENNMWICFNFDPGSPGTADFEHSVRRIHREISNLVWEETPTRIELSWDGEERGMETCASVEHAARRALELAETICSWRWARMRLQIVVETQVSTITFESPYWYHPLFVIAEVTRLSKQS